MLWKAVVCAGLMFLASGGPLLAQGTQMGMLRGTVMGPDKAPLPGATITLRSPVLQADRSTTADATGAFLFRGIPPGAYTATVTLDKMKTVEQKVDVPLGGVAEISVMMPLASRQEAITVTAETPVMLTTPTVGANITRSTVEALANPRGLVGIANLAPGVTMNTPNSGQLAINGAFAYDNVFLINGVDVDDNLFGSPQKLFIEDAIQETQVLTSGISAEYGRFTGGVINAITKSGGNIFSGSFRTNLSNPTWSTLTPFDVTSGVTHTSKLNRSDEWTLGGPIRKDRLWFFTAGRVSNDKQQKTFPQTGINYTNIQDNKRGELKMTARAWQSQEFQLSYINNSTHPTEPPFDFSIEPRTIVKASEPNSIVGVTWHGVLSNSLFAEAGYSQRRFAFIDYGGASTSIVDSPMIGLSVLTHFNAPYFDATDPERRNNQQITGSVSYTVSKVGRHDVKTGYEWFRSQRTGGNSQSATNYVFDADYVTDAAGKPVTDPNGFLIPIFEPGVTVLENWIPQRGAVSNVDTHSFFVQDHWTATRALSFDLGTRFEKVHSQATGGIVGVNTTTIVPRLAMAIDPHGTGRVVVHVTYAHYAGKYNESLIGPNNNVGNPDATFGIYAGPAGEGRGFAPGFNTANYQTVAGHFPTANVSVAPGLSSPITKEFTVSAGSDVAKKGSAQLTYVWRATHNFMEDFIDIANGTTHVVKNGLDVGTFTNVIVGNSDLMTRSYQGLVLQGRYHWRANVLLAGNWTIQLKNDGNYEGEATNQPGFYSFFGDYPGANGQPSIYDPARHSPAGHLNNYQRSKIRVWAIYTADLGRRGLLTASGLIRHESPRVFSFQANRIPLTDIQNNLLAAEGYPDAPSSQQIFFGARGSQQFAGYTLFDMSFTYDIPVAKKVRPWVKVDIYNVFNNQKLISWDTTLDPDPNSPTDSRGLPTGFIKAPSFGKATSANNYPQPFQDQTGGRTFLVAVGVRF